MAIRVFLAEDQRAMRELIADVLDSVGGYELVGMAADENAATEWLLRHRNGWDLAIIDLLLEHGTGFTLLSRFAREPSGSTLVFSDFVTPGVKKRCLRLGADAVLNKGSFPDLRKYLQDFRQMPRDAAA